jgi:hypothetical protein
MANQFCEKCQAESSDESAGNYREGMFGRQFMGRARACAQCGSYAATLWQLFLYFPTSPVGTYRYLHLSTRMGGWSFLSRKVEPDLEQIRKTRISGTISAIVVIALAAALLYWKYG